MRAISKVLLAPNCTVDWKSSPHMLVSGVTGSSKTNTLEDVLLSTISAKSRLDNQKIGMCAKAYIIDGKGSDLASLKAFHPAITPNQVARTLRILTKNMHMRYEHFSGDFGKTASDYFVSVDQVSVNFPVNKMGGLNTALQVAKDLRLSKIFGGSDKARALNYYSEAVSYYNGQIKFMWNEKKKSQGLLLYFSATGFKAWQNLGKLRGYSSTFNSLVKYMVQKKARFTRVDVAIDVIDGNLSVDQLHSQLQQKEIMILDSLKREKSEKTQKFYGANKVITGITCGARSSDNFLRVYDKKIEQDKPNAPHFDLAKESSSWMRIEGEFKHKAAHAILSDLKDKDEEELGQKLIGYVVNQWLLTEAKYSQSYASVVYTAFRQSLDYAVEINLIPANPSLKTKSVPKGKATAKYWTKEEFEKVLSSVSVSSFYERLIYVTFLFFYRMGCRVSGAGALRWSDVDLNNGKVRFINNLHYKNKMEYELVPYLKNDSSRRTLTLDDELVRVLEDWKKNSLSIVFMILSCPMTIVH